MAGIAGRGGIALTESLLITWTKAREEYVQFLVEKALAVTQGHAKGREDILCPGGMRQADDGTNVIFGILNERKHRHKGYSGQDAMLAEGLKRCQAPGRDWGTGFEALAEGVISSCDGESYGGGAPAADRFQEIDVTHTRSDFVMTWTGKPNAAIVSRACRVRPDFRLERHVRIVHGAGADGANDMLAGQFPAQ